MFFWTKPILFLISVPLIGYSIINNITNIINGIRAANSLDVSIFNLENTRLVKYLKPKEQMMIIQGDVYKISLWAKGYNFKLDKNKCKAKGDIARIRRPISLFLIKLITPTGIKTDKPIAPGIPNLKRE